MEEADIKVKTAMRLFQLLKLTIFVQFLTCFELRHFFRYNESNKRGEKMLRIAICDDDRAYQLWLKEEIYKVFDEGVEVLLYSR